VFKLDDIKHWHEMGCVPTMLCAISGKSPSEILTLLNLVLAKRGEEPTAELRRDYNINDWLSALRELGANYVQAEDDSAKDYAHRLTINEYMQHLVSDELHIIFGESADGCHTHVFAIEDGHIVDTFTEGKESEICRRAGRLVEVSDQAHVFDKSMR
jgi:hypothetical protein